MKTMIETQAMALMRGSHLYRSVRNIRNGRLLSLVLPVLTVMFSVACSDQIVSECDVPPVPIGASHADIEQRVFAQSCALPGCHAGSDPAAGLDLSVGNSYDALVGVTSTTNPPKLRVSPGEPEESVLITALRWNSTPVMPPSGPLESAVVDSIAVWIANGALRN